jgi:hypothetical protein
MLQIQGRSDLLLVLEIIKKVVAIGPLLVGIFINIYWMLIGRIVTGLIVFFLNSFYSGKLIGYSSWMQLKDVAPSYLIAIVVALSVYFLKIIPLTYWIILPLQLLIGSIVFFVLCETIKFSEYIEVKEIALQYFKKYLRKK